MLDNEAERDLYKVVIAEVKNRNAPPEYVYGCRIQNIGTGMFLEHVYMDFLEAEIVCQNLNNLNKINQTTKE